MQLHITGGNLSLEPQQALYLFFHTFKHTFNVGNWWSDPLSMNEETFLLTVYFYLVVLVLLLKKDIDTSSTTEGQRVVECWELTSVDLMCTHPAGLELKPSTPVRPWCKTPGEPSVGSWGVCSGGTGPGTAHPWPARPSSSCGCPLWPSHPAASLIPAGWWEEYPALPLPPRQRPVRGWWWCHQSRPWLRRWWAGRSRSWSDLLRRAWWELPSGGHRQWSLEEKGNSH